MTRTRPSTAPCPCCYQREGVVGSLQKEARRWGLGMGQSILSPGSRTCPEPGHQAIRSTTYIYVRMYGVVIKKGNMKAWC